MQSLAEAIAAEPDMELVDVLASPDMLAAAIKGRDMDVVITERLDGDPTPPTMELLYGHPRLRMLSLSVAGLEVVLHELRPHEVKLGNMSLHALLQTIRGEPWSGAPRDVLPAATRVSDVRGR